MTSERYPSDAFISRDAVDPSLRGISRVLPHTYALHRGFKIQRALMKLVGTTGRLDDVPVAAVNADVTVRLHRPARLPRPAPALLWIHGGGTLMGTSAMDDKYCRKMAHLAGIAIASVEYRLAPEHPYPIPVDDCYSALIWLANQPWVDSTRVAVGGASAGGHFSATVAQRARDRGEVQLASQMLIYPQLDDRTGAQPDGRKRFIWNENDNQLAWRLYLDGADPIEAAPGRCADLSGLPPAWIGVGSLDLFHQECIEYARRLRAAGVQVTEEVVPGAFHIFDQLMPSAPISAAFFASQIHFLQQTLGSASTISVD